MYRISESLRATHGQDGAIVLDIRQGRMFNLNLIASRILQSLEAGREESTIADEISDRFQVSREIAAQDLREFIRVLKSQRLIEEL